MTKVTAHLGCSSDAHFHAERRIPLQVGEKVSLVSAGVQIQILSAFVDVDQWHDIRPLVAIHRPYVGNLLIAQELPRLGVWHETFSPEHFSSKVRNNCRRHVLLIFSQRLSPRQRMLVPAVIDC